MNDLKLIFFGTPKFAVDSLHEINLNYSVNCVVTSPDRKSGRGQKISQSEVKNYAKKNNIKILQPDNLNDKEFINKIKEINPDIIIVVAFRKLPAEIFSIPKYGTINLHAGKLPEYRGGSPLNWQIINGEKFAYLTTIFTDEGIDTGNILKEQKIEILDKDDIKSLHKKANKIFPKMLLESIKMVRENNFGKKQNEANASYWHQRSDADGYLDFQNNDAEKIVRIVKAITKPYPGAWGLIQGQKVRIYSAKISEFAFKGTPGKTILTNGINPVVICKKESIEILNYEFEKQPNRKLSNNDRFE